MDFELKDYQKTSLKVLREFLEEARVAGPEKAFNESWRERDPAHVPPSYRKIEGLEDIPYVCLRLPTGGGKTVLAAYSIAEAARSYLEQAYPVVLWLVPSNTIRAQTLEVLKKPTHLCRVAINDAFEGRVAVFDISEIEQIRPQDLTEKVCLIVGTLATLRVNNTEGRKIYAHNENFEAHFSRVSPSRPGLERIEDGPDTGKIKFSFANLLHIRQPMIIMDEAHNARTSLTFEVLQRIRPACIIEYTATPDTGKASASNVLFRVSASELKAEDMIKLPIMLTEHNNWQEALRDAILTRKKLELKAKEDNAYIRPIALIQAESKDKEVTVEVLRRHLIENEKIDAENIAVATGSQRDLDGIALFDPNCKIEYVITMEALKEGWDCSFAYVFCSVANIHSSKDVEQLLGRVLRMPYAKKRLHDELNRAYANVSSPDFAKAASQLHDRLVSMGFEEEEIDAYLQRSQPALIEEADLPLLSYKPVETFVYTLAHEPDFSCMSAEESALINVAIDDAGKVQITVKGDITDEMAEKIVSTVPTEQLEDIKKRVHVYRTIHRRNLTPAEKGVTLTVPRLCVWIQGELELVEKELFLDAKGWNLLDYPAELSEAEFSINETARTFEVDVQGRRVVYGLVDDSRQLDLSNVPTALTTLDFSRQLDKQVRQKFVRQEVMLEFLRHTIAYLTDKRKFKLANLIRSQYPLAKVLIEKIKAYYQQAHEKGYQAALFAPEATVETSFDFPIIFTLNNYCANWYYKQAPYKFRKHFHPLIGELESSGEEFECAKILDSLPQVKHWIRNISKSKYSFGLPTSTDMFWPDFVAELTDGCILVVEYKGKQYISNDDSKEKRNLGELWEEKSGGKVLFVMAEKKDAQGRNVYKQLMDKIESSH